MDDMDPTSSSFRLRTEKVIKKIPGNLLHIPSGDKGDVEKLSLKSTSELKELLVRQDKILSNKFLLSKLRDKGEKATELKQKIEQELANRNAVDTASNLLANMSLGQLNDLEWTGHCSPGYRTSSCYKENGIEDDETDPLKIIATHSGVTSHQKQVRSLKAEASLIRAEDLAEIKASTLDKPSQSVPGDIIASQTSNVVLASNPQSASGLHDKSEPFAQFICNRYGHAENKDRFKPNKPLKPFTGVFPMEPPGRISSKINRLEETNVTPPIPIFENAKILTLEESMELQQQQAQKLKEVQMKHAAEKLLAQQGCSSVAELPVSIISSMSYRRPVESSSESDDDGVVDGANLEEQEELHDDDQCDRDTAVVYTVAP